MPRCTLHNRVSVIPCALYSTMTTKYGDFLAPVFHTIGDPYMDANAKGARDKGLAFIATVGRRGKVMHPLTSSRFLHLMLT